MVTAFAPGEVIAERYELRRDLGRRAAGRLFEAEHRHTGRRVALRVGRATWLLAAARQLASVKHPGIADVFDAGQLPDDQGYVALDLVAGRSLEGLLAMRGRLERADAVALALQLCDALAAAHARGVVHGDIDARHVFVVREDKTTERVRLVGFMAGGDDPSRDDPASDDAAVQAPAQSADIQGVGRILLHGLNGLAGESSGGDIERLMAPHGAELVRIVEGALGLGGFSTIGELGRALEPLAASGRGTKVMQPPPLPKRSASRAAMQAVSLVPAVQSPPAQSPAAQSPAPPAVEGRRFARAPYGTPVRITLPDGTFADGRSEDISEGGMLFVATQDCPRDRVLEARFALPIDGKIITTRVVVRWMRPPRSDAPNGPRGIGVEWRELAEATRATIARYVQFMGDPNAT